MDKKIDTNRGKKIQTTISQELMNKIDNIVLYDCYMFGYKSKSDFVRRAIKYLLDNIVEIDKESLLENFEYLKSTGCIEETNFYDFMKGIMNKIDGIEYIHRLDMLY